jgi:UDP-N-acetylglucosamine acyltransferase
MTQIHPTAIISDGAKIGANVTIGAFCIIEKDIVLGDGCELKSHVCLYGNTTIGKNNIIYSHAVIGSIPQDLKYSGEEVELIIGDNNQFREFTFINPGTKGGGYKTIIGSNSLFMGYVHIGHDCIIGDSVIIANSTQLAGHVEIGDESVIGGLTGIIQFTKIGNNVMIGASSLVDQDIPPYTLAQGNRAVLRGLNLNGLRRKFKDREIINSLKSAYNDMFISQGSLQDEAKRLLNSDIAQVRTMAEFVTQTKKGIPYNYKDNKNNE